MKNEYKTQSTLWPTWISFAIPLGIGILGAFLFNSFFESSQRCNNPIRQEMYRYELHVRELTDKGNYSGRWKYTSGKHYIFLKENNIEVISHEVSHSVGHHMKLAGINDEEARAYLQGWVTKEVANKAKLCI